MNRLQICLVNLIILNAFGCSQPALQTKSQSTDEVFVAIGDLDLKLDCSESEMETHFYPMEGELFQMIIDPEIVSKSRAEPLTSEELTSVFMEAGLPFPPGAWLKIHFDRRGIELRNCPQNHEIFNDLIKPLC